MVGGTGKRGFPATISEASLVDKHNLAGTAGGRFSARPKWRILKPLRERVSQNGPKGLDTIDVVIDGLRYFAPLGLVFN